MIRPLLLLVLVSCAKIPDHLRLPDSNTSSPLDLVENKPQLIAALIGSDPLVRAPTLPTIDQAERIDPTGEIVAWIEEIQHLEQGEGDPAQRLQQLEEKYNATVVVPLARGARLRRAENLLRGLTNVDADDRATQIAALLSPLQPTDAAANMTTTPLHFLGDRTQLQAYGDRWVLSSWLHSPELSSEPIRRALQQPQFDKLRQDPIGAILEHRDPSTTPKSVDTAALNKLERATLLALTRTAADRDTEQSAWAQALDSVSTELHTTTPISDLLESAFTQLLKSAARDDDAGAAWIAATARRWLGSCDDTPCEGLDRTESFRNAERWGPSSEKLARIWQVIALKDAMDSMDVGHDTVIYATAAVQLSDALVGTGAGPLPLSILQRHRGDPAVWLALSRSVGGDGATDWETTKVQLGKHLALVTDRALDVHNADVFTPLLQTIRNRAQR